MRVLSVLLLLPLFVVQAHAQTGPVQPAVSPATPAAAAPSTETPAASHRHAAQHHRMGWKQRFAAANTAHDGHLTLEQAKTGYITIARHFTAIDVGKKGFVTVEDIDTWHKLQRAMHHAKREHDGQSLRPRHAMQHGMPEPRAMKTSTDTKVEPMTQPGTPSGTADAPGGQSAHGT